jgi:hypothetical protein
LLESIKNHTLWKQVQLWEEIIEISIYDEFRQFEAFAPETEGD